MMQLTVSAAQQFSNEWSHFTVLSIVSKVEKLCIAQGFTLGVKGVTASLNEYKLGAFEKRKSTRMRHVEGNSTTPGNFPAKHYWDIFVQLLMRHRSFYAVQT